MVNRKTLPALVAPEDNAPCRLRVDELSPTRSQGETIGSGQWSGIALRCPRHCSPRRDPNGNIIELHQFDQGRCRAISRK